ncbi:MAG: outer membrane lipid asymmetry maintenance protein MlaD [Desulfobacula sp.]|jgi:phospholipid/cholesterol/gamma-HCH transport system substrate-binding protein|uniref:outer membrane lipid asymmetry maintenance protein MlaD n=1 Tax=Desulfobacula sp. TaxID=2593537 RepID=UPI001E0BF594|nr:outer membrane lipid asymmetry maintenance protein MlaD [Desulfobacula sp.]MBT3484408.1 outer membrane lipid asymmetry maintenance protein MlaD [Desulfobacula sp.]MBT3803323.1 outer membrane lipid asymmetry maintenance protein MlaD [Desulfobacula sp.]MBT4023711.1 outer membrane lipid asymmetry maintenance protein MlaD [Desulfobacula sp.]MBT4197953.1 outer membrane lipid asymmetry maintenance protein MlaD [Desulfobacula sp.]
MDKRKIEFYVGLFVIIGVLCTGYLFIVLGEISFVKDKQYPVYAFFSSVSGLKTGAKIEMVGVQIGMVSKVNIDKERLLAKVELSIDKNIELSEDVIASVKTSGIIGQKYIDIQPGGSDIILGPGEEIFNTESSLDIESLVRKLIFIKNNK